MISRIFSIASVAFLIISLTIFPALVMAGDRAARDPEEQTKVLQKEINELLNDVNDDLGGANLKISQLKKFINKLIYLSSERNRYNAKAAIARGQSKGRDIEAEYASCANLSDQTLINALHKLVDNHIALTYKEARVEFFSHLDNVDGYVECVYTGRKVKTNKIPNGTNMNCEHTWPQSQGAVGIARTDIHHLFPTDSKSNSVRWHLPFGTVTNADWSQGGSSKGNDVFEVREKHRGNTARAKFYFSIRYELNIGEEEEAILKQWNIEDPVDDAERARNNGTDLIQKNRNPFVDHPEFAAQIADF